MKRADKKSMIKLCGKEVETTFLLDKILKRKLKTLFKNVTKAASENINKQGEKYPNLCIFKHTGCDVMITSEGELKLIEINGLPDAGFIGMTKGMMSEMTKIELEIRDMKENGLEIGKETKFQSQKQWIRCF